VGTLVEPTSSMARDVGTLPIFAPLNPHGGQVVGRFGHKVLGRLLSHCVSTTGQIVGPIISWQTVGMPPGHLVSMLGHSVSFTGHSDGGGPPGMQCVATVGHSVSTAGHCVLTSGHCVAVAGHWVATAGQNVVPPGHCVLTAGHWVLTAGH
jgi:hypothetical protein